MNAITQINNQSVSIISHNAIPVLTTEQLANFYGTSIDNIRKNFSNNSDRFVQGKHYFKLEGAELKGFKDSVNDIHAVKKGARTVNLWTERGAARHAKMLDTDQAWEVFEQLEDCYFVRKEILAKTHKSDREPLTSAVNLLVAKTKHLNYSDAYKLVHQRFNVEHIDEISYDTIPVAVEYVHHLIALYSNTEKKQPDHLPLIKNLVDAIISQNCSTFALYRAAYALDRENGMYLSEFAFQTNTALLKLTRSMDLRGPHNRKIISDDLKTASYTCGGQHFGSMWFHPLVESSRLMGALQISGGWQT